MVRRIYPHDRMEDAVYAFAVKALDERVRRPLQFCRSWKKASPSWTRWRAARASLDEHQQWPCSKNPEQRFFSSWCGTSVNSLYSNELAYEHFGYEGASSLKAAT